MRTIFVWAGILGTALTVIPLPEAWLPSDVTIEFRGRQ